MRGFHDRSLGSVVSHRFSYPAPIFLARLIAARQHHDVGPPQSAHRFTQQPVNSDIWIALAWCAGVLVVAYVVAMMAYRRKIA